MSEEAWESTLAPLHECCVWTWLAWGEGNERFPDSVQTKPKGCWHKYKARVVLQENGKKMPLKQNSPKWHETANRRRGLWEQFFTIRSLLFLWMLEVFHNRSQKKPAESLFQKPFWIPWLSSHHCNYQTARATDTANWLFPSKAACCWSYSVNAGALGSSSRQQRAWSSSQHPLGEWETYQPLLCV